MISHRSPAFTAIYNEIKNSDRNCILDLGAMNAGCFSLFSELSCKIQVEDLRSHICESIHEEVPLDVERCLNDYPKIKKFDVILAWDLFNYLTLGEINKVFKHLSPHCKPNTLVFMMRYGDGQAPQYPREYFVKDQYELHMSDDITNVNEEATNVGKAKNYSTIQLLSSMQGCFVQDTQFAKDGMIRGITEHVVRYSPTFESKHLIGVHEVNKSNKKVRNQDEFLSKQHNSPALCETINQISTARDFIVLDLGSSDNRPEDILLRRAASYYRVDLFSIIERSVKLKSECLNLSPLAKHTANKFDLILAWDLFNYCTPMHLAQLNRALSKLSHQDTVLLSFMYTGRNRPCSPSHFEVDESGSVNIDMHTQKEPNEGISGATLLRILQAFNMEKTFAYRPGMDRGIIEYYHRCQINTAEVLMSQTG